MNLTILICSHDRAALLEKTLISLNAAKCPVMPVEILVVANACSDNTIERMRAYQEQQGAQNWIPLQFLEVSTPGKSHALNNAIPRIVNGLIAFVDDDHRVNENYLIAIEHAAAAWPDASMFCGRILPDWDGTEPSWVHDKGPYRIYPLPIPRYDQGQSAKTITLEGPLPGGGNLIIHRDVFTRTGEFSTTMGPHGHDLGGGEDSDFVQRALIGGEHLQYSPDILQYHFVDPNRLRLIYILRKGFQRSRSHIRVRSVSHKRIPRYMWRKLITNFLLTACSWRWARMRFYLSRLASTLGEIQGMLDQQGERK